MKPRIPKFHIGDRVCISPEYLNSIHYLHGPMRTATGTITEIKGYNPNAPFLVTVDWTNGGVTHYGKEDDLPPYRMLETSLMRSHIITTSPLMSELESCHAEVHRNS